MVAFALALYILVCGLDGVILAQTISAPTEEPAAIVEETQYQEEVMEVAVTLDRGAWTVWHKLGMVGTILAPLGVFYIVVVWTERHERRVR